MLLGCITMLINYKDFPVIWIPVNPAFVDYYNLLLLIIENMFRVYSVRVCDSERSDALLRKLIIFLVSNEV